MSGHAGLLGGGRLRRRETHVASALGVTLLRRSWEPPEPECVVLVVHGLAEHSGRYEELGVWLADRNVAVYAFDQRGHGRSGGPRGHARRLDDLLDDVQLVLESVRAEHPGLPVALVGHSMGGLLTAAFLNERRPEVKCAVTSGAALMPPPSRSRARTAATAALSWLAPRRRIPIGLDPGGLSRDPEVVRRYVGDPLVLRHMTLGLRRSLLTAMHRTARGGGIPVPVLVLHGGDDPVCAAEGSRTLHAGLRADGSALRIYPGLRHEIFNEPERETIFQDVLDWLRRR